jgi:preprotein translocase subunit SecA
MVGNLLAKVFGTQNERDLKRLRPLVEHIGELESTVRDLSDTALRDRTLALRQRATGGEALDELLPDAFATVREAGRRVLAMRHYDVQLIGGMVLHNGKIGEMKTGEGKTLMATLPAYLNALSGKGVHVVTVNDYLARRDAEWMGRIYRFLGLSVGVIQHDLNDEQRQAAYGCDITYGTNNEFGFDYLRDNMKFDLSRMVQRGHHFAIVDEVDSILIDEARTPLIISGPAEESNDLYYEVDRIIPQLTRGMVHQGQMKTEDRDRMEASGDYTVDEKNKTVTLTEAGIARAEKLLAHRLLPGGLYDPANMPLLHHVQQGLRAHTHYRLDVEYMIKDGQVVIVDEFTGRLMPGRRWSDGLHQAVEAKEGVKIERENQTLATITFQNYFRKYGKLSGMTGTAETEAPEFNKIYKLDVMVIPTNKPMLRIEEPDLVYRTAAEKYEAIVADIIEKQESGRPVLVGTVSIEKSEKISGMLKRRGIKHVVLNAKYHAQEAEIVAQAGRKGAVTIATNMAGRGTDILLGGNPEYMARQQALNEAVAQKLERGEERFVDDDEFVYFSHGDNYRVPRADWDRIFGHFKAQCEAEHKDVVAVGGLHILGTERHEARRIDNQLRGRAGRQGDPGSSRFYLSLEDDLMRIFGSDRISGLMQRLGMEEGVPIEHGMVTRAIERAQKQVEAQNFAVRKHLLEYDDVMNKQRESVYTLRREILEGIVRIAENETSDTRGYLLATAEDIVDDKIDLYASRTADADTWDLEALKRELAELFAIDDDDYATVPFGTGKSDEIRDALWERVQAKYVEKERVIPAEILRRVERDLLLQIVDSQWKDHLYSLDHLKDGISLRSYGQRDPLVEYKKESYQLFQDMRSRIEAEMVRYLWWLRPVEGQPDAIVAPARPAPRRAAPLTYSAPSDSAIGGFPPPPSPSGFPAPAATGFPPPAAAPRPARSGGDDAPVTTIKRDEPKIGRNDPCWCGSGKKYKKCHGAN